MHRLGPLSRIATGFALGATILAGTVLLTRFAPAASSRPLLPSEFIEVAPQGFGDRQNSAVWSMAWWRGDLYVGTVRAWYCWVEAWAAQTYPRFVSYPPVDPDIQCAADPTDLPLQAEIWRYTPQTLSWARVYQSPNDVPIPGHPGKFTARDVGYRTMAVFTEADGTEALYVGGATVNLLWPPMPPPRILRSTDGTTFNPVPQDPGTLLGGLGQNQATFRAMEVYKGRLYVINGRIRGYGAVLEAENPAGGNDNFRWVTPEGMRVFDMAAFNGALYVGLGDPSLGGAYAVVKTDATGTPPYTFTSVVEKGGFLRPVPSNSVVSMHVFNGRLYVGTNRPAEVIRINPDDTWDLVLGEPRRTPHGWKYPLSGLDAGFDWPLNVHIWRMQGHAGVLYVGTNDESTRWRRVPGADPVLRGRYGFDLYATADGQYFTPVTVTGFEDRFTSGLRNFASTPFGLFLGSSNFWLGLKIWQGTSGATNGSSQSPTRLELESKDRNVILSWDSPPGATRFHVFRGDFGSRFRFQEIGETDGWFLVDTPHGVVQWYQYYVVAEDAVGSMSGPSNVLRAPPPTPALTFNTLDDALVAWKAPITFRLQLRAARASVTAGNLHRAWEQLERMRRRVTEDPTVLNPWRAEDAEILLAKLARRVRLAQAGIISPRDLLQP